MAGNRKAGAGSMEIVTVVPGELIRIDLKFTKPFKARNEVLFAFRPTDDDAESTEVTWTMNGRKLLPMRVLSRVGLADMDTMLGPDGTTVSGGERRRLLLARAVVRRGPVLLLDEPTEHLDTARGDALLAALLTQGDESLVPASSTVVVVTHRPEAVPADTPVLRIGEPR